MYPQMYPQIPRDLMGLLWTAEDSIDVKKPAFKRVSEESSDCIGLLKIIFWCPRAESNHDLMITNQLHDLHATGADLTVAARIIAEAKGYSILADEILLQTNSKPLAHAT
jgi:hypothetical protein